MSDYPREDKTLTVCLADSTHMSGMVNIAGRTTRDVLEDKGPDLVLYNARSGDGMPLGTVFVGKNRILWIAPAGETEQRGESGLLKTVTLKLSNGQAIIGRIDISGFERLSDYFQECRQRFYEVLEASLMDRTYGVLYVAVPAIASRRTGRRGRNFLMAGERLAAPRTVVAIADRFSRESNKLCRVITR